MGLSRRRDGAPGGTRWIILALLFGISSLAYFQRLNIQVAADAMMPDLGLSLVQMGWIFAAFSWSYALFQFPGGLVGVRFGFRGPLLAIGLAWALLTLLTGALPGTVLASTGAVVAGLWLVRFALGVAQAPVFPLQAGVIEAWFPVNGWALPNALLTCGLGFGAAAATPVTAWVMETFGWRAAFTVLAPIGLPLLVVWWWLMRDDPARHPRLRPDELALIRAGRPSSVAARTHGSWKRVLRDRQVVLLTLSYFAGNYVYYVFFQWLYLYLVEERGFGRLQSGVLAALPWMTGSVAALVGGAVCDALCRRIGPRWGCRLPCLVALPAVGVLLLIGSRADSPITAVTCLTLCFALFQLTDPIYWAGATFVGGTETAAATGVLNTGGNLPGILTGIAVPVLIARFGWNAAFASGAIFALVAGLLWLAIDVERPLATKA
ncbi:MAG TPA: MFS transporter [Thermoanaerobaculia bacterium]|nr:MFS transporter [Thermoanaerobaculia bacterium]